MSHIKLQDEALRGTAQTVRRLCGNASDVKNSINTSWGRLDAGWETYAREDITAMYRRAEGELKRTHDMLSQISTALVQTSSTLTGADRQAMRQFAKLTGSYAGTRRAGVGSVLASRYGQIGLRRPPSNIGKIIGRIGSADSKFLGGAISAGLMVGTKFLPPPFGAISALVPKPVFDAVGGVLSKVVKPVASFVSKVISNPVAKVVGGVVKGVGKFFKGIFG